MEIYGKSLIYIVFLLILLIVIDRFLSKLNIKEYFEEEQIITTNITNMIPFKGDSSTMVTLKGSGLNAIGRIIFKNDIEENSETYGECVIIDDGRSDEEMKYIPPPISELGISLNDVRDKMKRNEGYRVSIYLIRKDNNKIQANNPNNKDNFKLLQNVNFFYIDKIPYANNCPIINKPKRRLKEDENDIRLSPSGEPIYKKDGDLEFVNTILINQENKIDKTIKVLKNIIKKNDHYQNNNMDFIKTIQALDFLDKYKKNNNSYRYNLHKRISDRYNYDLF